jgi:hypothetical protein
VSVYLSQETDWLRITGKMLSGSVTKSVTADCYCVESKWHLPPLSNRNEVRPTDMLPFRCTNPSEVLQLTRLGDCTCPHESLTHSNVKGSTRSWRARAAWPSVKELGELVMPVVEGIMSNKTVADTWRPRGPWKPSA